MDRRKALIFDMDGTMFDTEPIFYRFWREISARYGYDLDRTVYDKMAGRDNVRTRSVCEEAFGPDYPYDKVCQEEVALQMDYYRHHDIPFKPGLCQLLDYARKEGLACAVASSSPRSMIEYLLERKGIASFFDVVQSGEEVPHGKPDPDIFLIACEKLGVRPETALVMEDSENGILAAHRAEFRPFGFLIWLKLIKRCRPWPGIFAKVLPKYRVSLKIRSGTDCFQSRTVSVKCCGRRVFQGARQAV